MMRAITQWYKREPVRAMGILKVLITLAVSLGLHLTMEQRAEIVTLVALVLGASGEITRSQVAPTATMPIEAKVAVDKQEKAEDAKAEAQAVETK